jgi:hypothetical protein
MRILNGFDDTDSLGESLAYAYEAARLVELLGCTMKHCSRGEYEEDFAVDLVFEAGGSAAIALDRAIKLVKAAKVDAVGGQRA